MAHRIFQLEGELQNIPEAAPKASPSFSVSEKLARYGSSALDRTEVSALSRQLKVPDDVRQHQDRFVMARTEVDLACNRASNLLFLPSDVQQPRATGTDLRTFLRRDLHVNCDHSRISS
jgi:hypothetical protein